MPAIAPRDPPVRVRKNIPDTWIALELVEGKFQFTTITLKPKLTLTSQGDAGKAKEILEKAEANCLISNSMKAKVTLEPTVN